MKPLLPLTLLSLLLAGVAWCASRAPRIYVNGLPAFAKAAAGKPLRSARGGPAAVIVKDGVTLRQAQGRLYVLARWRCAVAHLATAIPVRPLGRT